MKHIATRTALAISGAILVGIGSSLMAAPTTFLAMSEVFVERDAGLMSELTASSGMLFIVGTFMIFGAIRLRFAGLGLAAGALVYGSFGLSRFVSLHIHGTPSDSLVVVMYFELATAALLFALNPKIQSVTATKHMNSLDQEVTQ